MTKRLQFYKTLIECPSCKHKEYLMVYANIEVDWEYQKCGQEGDFIPEEQPDPNGHQTTLFE